MIADMINNNRLNSIVTELFISGRRLNVYLVFITQSYFKIPKDVRLNTTYFFITKIPNKRELQWIAINNSSDISTKDSIKIHKKYTTLHIIKSWQLMIRLKMKNYNMILIEKQPKYQLAKFININTLQVRKYCHQINNK